MIRRRAALLVLGSSWPLLPLAAQTFPQRTITLVVPFAPGGATDLLGRAIAAELSSSLQISVVVENRPGGGTSVAAQRLIRAPADGHHLLLASTSTMVVHPLLNPNPGFDVHRDFAGISMLAMAPMVLVTNARSQFHSAMDLVLASRSKPGQLNFASPGNGTSLHLAAELFSATAGIQAVHVPYRGSQQALQALLADEVQFYFDLIPSSKPLIESGQLSALGVTHRQRASALPNVPTLAEQGWQNFDASARFSLVAPSGTPASVIDLLNLALSKVLVDRALIARFSKMGLELGASSAQAVLAQFAKDRAEWGPLIRDRQIRLD